MPTEDRSTASCVSPGEPAMQQGRPTALTVVALLFLLNSSGAVWDLTRFSMDTVYPGGATVRHFHLNLGLLTLPAGIGLLRAQPAWRWVGLAFTAFWVGTAVTVTVSTLLSIRGSETVFPAATQQILLVMGALMALSLWMTHVLFRRDTRDWMAVHTTHRPWIEWAVLLAVVLLARWI